MFKSMYCVLLDSNLCCLCISRKNRWDNLDTSKKYSPANNKDSFMKGDNPFYRKSDIDKVYITKIKIPTIK